MKLRFGLVFLLLLAGCSRNQTPSGESARKTTASAIDPATASTISGVVTFDGDPPKPPPIDMSQDPACVIGKVPPNFGEAYAVNNRHLQNVYVYIKDGLGDYSYPPALPEILDQKGCRYVPHVLGLMVGQKLQVLNSDPALHNVHAMPKDNEGWNESQYPQGKPIEKSFAKPELMLPIQCNNHPWMKMYVNVSAHPFFAVTDADGKFTISGLPPGTYTLAALHEKMGEKTMKVTVGANEAKQETFSFASSDVK